VWVTGGSNRTLLSSPPLMNHNLSQKTRTTQKNRKIVSARENSQWIRLLKGENPTTKKKGERNENPKSPSWCQMNKSAKKSSTTYVTCTNGTGKEKRNHRGEKGGGWYDSYSGGGLRDPLLRATKKERGP